ncbi:protein Mpv17 isoform X4 [Vigna radiata var. radiata]|uniref:Protein Mpv17 isoform X4 n=1 Tax=Vigna radiata var. radiata TaxID=3916 RepID=A0A3Q0F5U4_VIGRR|nr:protein Mpv17 isoform X4 [Vigna radiata var. radiata]
MLKLWKWYQNCLAVHPVKTQVISSGLIWGAGDIAAQAVTHYTAKAHATMDEDDNKELKINWKRVSTTSLFGLGFVGPVGHYCTLLWYDLLLSLGGFDLKGDHSQVLQKATSIIFIADGEHPILFDSVPQIKEDVKRDFLPAFVLEGGIWPIVQVANFRFIPVRYQLLYVNFFCLLDSCFLSWVEQQQDAPWKQWLKSLLPLK